MNNKIGKTNDHPKGKLNEDDEGGLNIGVTVFKNKIVMEFGTSVKWIGMDAEDAVTLAESLLKFAEKIVENKRKIQNEIIISADTKSSKS